jgi:hypothetical protein
MLVILVLSSIFMYISSNTDGYDTDNWESCYIDVRSTDAQSVLALFGRVLVRGIDLVAWCGCHRETTSTILRT